MKLNVALIALLALVALITMPVQAQTITMSNPGGIAERDIIVYWPNGTMQGFYNSSSVITLDASSDYIFAMKPLSTNPLEDPGDWLTNTAFPFVQSNVIPLLVIMFMIGMVLSRRH
jgi:hypothetical protein